MAIINTTPKIQYYNGSPYEVKGSLVGYGAGGNYWNPNPGIFNPKVFNALVNRGVLVPYKQQQPASMPANQGAGTGNMTGKLPDMYNRLSMQASDALYGGILGYQPKPIT